jgi:hypothetical protein
LAPYNLPCKPAFHKEERKNNRNGSDKVKNGNCSNRETVSFVKKKVRNCETISLFRRPGKGSRSPPQRRDMQRR